MFKKQEPLTQQEFYSKHPNAEIDYQEYLEQFNEEQYNAQQEFDSWWNSLDDEQRYHYENTRPEAVAKRLKDLRKKLGATQEQIAKLIGVTKQTVSNYETGQSTPPNKILDKLSMLYGVPLHQILGTEQSKESAINNEIIGTLEYIKSVNTELYLDEIDMYYQDVHPTQEEWIILKITHLLESLPTEQLYEVFQYVGFKNIMNMEKEGLDFSSVFEENK